LRRLGLLCAVALVALNAATACASAVHAKRSSASASPAVRHPAAKRAFGDPKVESSRDSDRAGHAEAFPFANRFSGITASIKIYVDARNHARTLVAGLYGNRKGHPGTLIASGSVRSPKRKRWNTVKLKARALKPGRTYWVAILGERGTLVFRDRNKGRCWSQSSHSGSLRGLPRAWKSGHRWRTCPISAFVNGYPSAKAPIAPGPPTPAPPPPAPPAPAPSSPGASAPTPTQLTCSATTRCFYISYTSGSDSNAGTSTASPWKLAPGMQGFGGHYTPQTGDQFVFEGGDTWPSSVFPLTPTAGGSSSAYGYYGAGNHSWFIGSSWTRPTFDAQSDTKLQNFVDLSTHSLNDVRIDGIHFTNWAWSGDPGWSGSVQINIANTDHDQITNSLFDNWTHQGSCCDNMKVILGQNATNFLIQNDQVDMTSNAATYDSGWMEYEGGGTFDHDTCFDMEQCINPTGDNVVSNNLVYNVGVRDEYDGTTHTNAINVMGGNDSIFNNVVHDIGQGTMVVNWQAGGNTYVYNNVVWNPCGPDFCRSALQPDCTWGDCAGSHTYIYNNTIEAATSKQTVQCIRWTARSGDGLGGGDTYTAATIVNNHCIGSALNLLDPGVSITSNTESNNLVESYATATAQGYTVANQFQSAAATSPTVGAGANLTSACTGALTALCTGLNGTARPGSGAWDEGAWQRG
jgi:hypothetical protein